MHELLFADLLVVLMPYSLTLLYLWLGVAMVLRARRSGIKPWWAYGLSMSSLALQSALIVRPLGRAETDTTGLWLLGAGYAMMLSVPIVLLILGSRGLGKDTISPADLAFVRCDPVNAVGEHQGRSAAPAASSRRAALIALSVFIILVATSVFGVLLQPCAPGDLLLKRSGCLQTADAGEFGTHLTLSPDGSLWLTEPFSSDQVLLWDGVTARVRSSLRAGEPVSRAIFSRDSSTLALSGIDGLVTIWDTATGAPRGRVEGVQEPESVALSSDGQFLVAGTSGGLRLWRWDGQGMTPERFILGAGPSIKVTTLSADDELVAIVRGRPEGGSHITVWELRTGRQVSEIPEGPFGDLQFSPDGRLLIAEGSYFSERAMVRVWEVDTGRQVQTFGVDDWLISSIAISPDSTLVAASTFDDRLYVWSLTPDPQRRVFLPGSSARSMVFVDDSTLALGLYGDAVRQWRVR